MKRPASIALSVAVAALSSAQGKQLYGQYCVSCHGANGQGVAQGRTIGGAPQRIQEQQRGVGPSLRGVGALAADFYLRTGYMPLHRVGDQPRRARVLFDDAQIRALVAYIASLEKGPPIPKPRPERGNLSEGLHLFTDRCAGCHQVVAQGGVVSGALPPPLENATDVQIAEAVRLGPYLMPRFGEGELSDRDVASVARYVLATRSPDDRGGWGIGHVGPVPEGLVAWLVGMTAMLGIARLLAERNR